MKIVLATRNRDKTREIVDLLAGLDVAVGTLADYPAAPETVEDGITLQANALKKAREARAHSGFSALADDTGLEVDALGGAPGIFAARYAGEGASYADNCKKLLAALEGVGDRRARFRTVVALALCAQDADRLVDASAQNPEVATALQTVAGADAIVAEGILLGEIATHARGVGGFGYDPVFVDAGSGRTLAEMTPEQKNRSSHRYRALLEMREMLLRYHLAQARA
jgi:XTP/dITP diphosphohydrolase